LIRFRRAAALVALAGLASSCAAGSGGFSGKPADVYSVIPTQSDVRKLMGDDNWWEGAPTFGVQPLNAQTTLATEKFSVSQVFKHVGTDEYLFPRYTVFDKTSSATSYMSDVQNNLSNPPTSPKVGDQVIYTGAFGSGGAPYQYAALVRVGQIVLDLTWARKDRGVTIQMLAKNAKAFAEPLKNISKVHAKLRTADPDGLPPAGTSITLLGSTELPVEAFAVMILNTLPEEVTALMKGQGITTFPYGDYALNSDTHMEVQSALFTFPTAKDAADWAAAFSPDKPDDNGISFGYIQTSGTPAAGVYRFVFVSGRYGGFLICKPALDGTAASRECEDPGQRVALGWKLALGGLR